MSSFAALMALSQSQTQQSQSAVQSALAARTKREAQARKEREDKERHERELEARIRARKLEEDRRTAEREAKLAAERAAKEAERVRKENEARDKERILGNGRKTYPSSGGSRGHDEDANMALTREEKRRRKAELEMRRDEGYSRRAGGGNAWANAGNGKAGRKLAGGAVDMISDSKAGGLAGSSAPGNGMHTSARARLSAMPNTLTKLNVNKRDTRTIDEIVQDRAKAKVIAGDGVKEFNDWFGTSKKDNPVKDVKKIGSASNSGTSTPQPMTSSEATVNLLRYRANQFISEPVPSPTKAPLTKSSLPPKQSSKPSTSSLPSFKSRALTKPPASSSSSSRPTASSVTKSSSQHRATSPKRRRSTAPLSSDDLDSDEDRDTRSRPSKKPRSNRDSYGGGGGSGVDIWAIMNPGRDRNAYMARDVLSDEEEDDMEVSVAALEREEKRSRLIAKKEEEMAEAEERRRMEEKRKRKMGKD
jgi:protein SPT2